MTLAELGYWLRDLWVVCLCALAFLWYISQRRGGPFA